MATHKTKVSNSKKTRQTCRSRRRCVQRPRVSPKNGISVPSFYKFKNRMPVTFTIGSRRLVSREAAARWRAEREAATEAEDAR